jgi:hypothetical protein
MFELSQSAPRVTGGDSGAARRTQPRTVAGPVGASGSAQGEAILVNRAETARPDRKRVNCLVRLLGHGLVIEYFTCLGDPGLIHLAGGKSVASRKHGDQPVEAVLSKAKASIVAQLRYPPRVMQTPRGMWLDSALQLAVWISTCVLGGNANPQRRNRQRLRL